MSKWFLALLVLRLIAICASDPNLIIVQNDDYDYVPDSVEAPAGSNLYLTCILEGEYDTDLVWGKRSREFWFKNENDLKRLAELGSKQIHDLQNKKDPLLQLNRATKVFRPLKLEDRGVYFCMSLEYTLFKIIHIKVQDGKVSSSTETLTCGVGKFKCVESGTCIKSSDKCDGKSDCPDDSDEDWEICRGDPCEGKIRCGNSCIPTSRCCDKRTEKHSVFACRPSCCPPLPVLTDVTQKILYEDTNNVDTAEKKSNSNTPTLILLCCAVVAVILLVYGMFFCLYFGKSYERQTETSASPAGGHRRPARHHVDNLPVDAQLETRNSTGGLRMPMPATIVEDNETSAAFSFFITPEPLVDDRNIIELDYLDPPPSYYEASTRSSPQSSAENSHQESLRGSVHGSENNPRAPVVSGCDLLPSYDEALANSASTVSP